jgi:hypothetical protein
LGESFQVEEVLSELQATGVYKPDLILGISNGGLFLADTILRLVYKNDVPMMALWAQRSKDEYFNNPINNALITEDVILTFARDGISSNPTSANTPTSGRSRAAAESRNPSRLVRILGMDDIVGTQRTFTQLVEYLRKRLGQTFDSIELRFVFLFTPRPETLETLSSYLLSQDPKVVRDFRAVDLESITGKSDLPYRKSIHTGFITQPDAVARPATANKDVGVSGDSG